MNDASIKLMKFLKLNIENAPLIAIKGRPFPVNVGYSLTGRLTENGIPKWSNDNNEVWDFDYDPFYDPRYDGFPNA